jgi:hypothetical protein
MQDLFRTLQDRDLGHLRIVADFWGIELASAPAPQAARQLASAMLDPAMAAEQAESLPPQARQALEVLRVSGARMPIADLIRRFGPLREMGPGRRDREKPWRDPVSPIEILWYRGWLARAFSETPSGPQEFAFIPSDLARLLPAVAPAPISPPGGPAPDPAWPTSAPRTAPDDATTLLAALRRRSAGALPLPSQRMQALQPFLFIPHAGELLLSLLREEGVLAGPPFRPSPQATRQFLESPHGAASARLLRAWASSRTWNDLAHVPDLEAPGGRWPNDPLQGRHALLRFVQQVPEGIWWDLTSFVEAVREGDPSFQRPGGDFDSWYLQSAGEGEFLKGFEAWDAVEGALIRHTIRGPLHWLGACDLGADREGGAPTTFRRTPLSALLWDSPGAPEAEKGERITLLPDGRLIAPVGASRVHRYQISRAASWLRLSDEGYEFRLTPSSLKVAAGQGLEASHITAIIEAATGRLPAPALQRAIARALARGPEARLEHAPILRVSSPRLLQALRADRSAARLLGESLGPTAVRIELRNWEKLCAAAARLGVLLDSPEA